MKSRQKLHLYGRNTASGIGIVSINASKLTAEQRNSIAVAQLDNSYMVKQGDLVIASGKLYETSKGVSYGTIAGSKVEYSKDSGYEVFETSVSITLAVLPYCLILKEM